MFYDAAAGEGQFYITNNGKIGSPVKTFTGWRNTWSQIIPGNFGGSGGLNFLFYEASSGTAEFYVLGSDGAFNWFATATLPTNLTLIVPGNFSGKGTTDLLCYDARAGTGVFYSVTKGQIHAFGSETGWRSSWKQIISTPKFTESEKSEYSW